MGRFFKMCNLVHISSTQNGCYNGNWNIMNKTTFCKEFSFFPTVNIKKSYFFNLTETVILTTET